MEKNTKLGKALKAVLLCFVFLLAFVPLQAQLYTLQDINMRNKLQKDYPSVMTGDQLNTVAAAALSGTLDLSRSNISNADGIQFFTGISTLQLQGNNISVVPDLSGYKNLVNLYLSFNKLITLPNLSMHRNLYDLQAANNQLISFPDLSSLSGLVRLYCANNKITTFPNLFSQVNLEELVIGNNPLHNLPDVSGLQKLKQLHVHQTFIDTIIGLGSLSNLEVLYAWENNIKNLNGLNNNTRLTVMEVTHNRLKTLPNLLNKPLLKQVAFAENDLTFEDILPVKNHPFFNNFVYAPQNTVRKDTSYTTEKANFWPTVDFDLKVTDNQYAWSKDGISLPGNSTGVYKINGVTGKDAGVYKVIITNAQLPKLVIESYFPLNVTPCIHLTTFKFTLVESHCTSGATIDFEIADNTSPQSVFRYTLITSSRDTIPSTATRFQNIPSGKTVLLVENENQCKAEKTIDLSMAEDCPTVFSPDEDGVLDEYYINEQGKIDIYDKNRVVIRSFTGPALWDGRKFNGELADSGLYAIVVNDKKVVHITVLR